MCLLLAAPTSTHGVFTSFSLSQYCCLHFWGKRKRKKKVWVHVGARIFKGQRSSKNHKMLLFVSWCNKYAIIEWPLFDAPTSTHGVFTSFSLPQYCCLHFWRNKVGSMLAQGFVRVKSQAKITKCYFLWVGAINMQSLNGHYLMCKQVPMVFLLLLVYLGAVAYISVEISLGSCWRRDILRVKGQALFTNCNFLWLCVICNHREVTTRCAIKYPWCLYFF